MNLFNTDNVCELLDAWPGPAWELQARCPEVLPSPRHRLARFASYLYSLWQPLYHAIYQITVTDLSLWETVGLG